MLQRPNKTRRDSGFTLIELLIVIVILGILAAIVVFAVNGIQDRGTASACKADVETVTVAAEAYDAEYGRYAESMQQLVKEGFLHSLPSTTNGYRVDYVPNNDARSPSVDVSSDYCPAGDAGGPTSTGPSSAGSPYCNQLSQTITRYSSLRLSSVDDGTYQSLQRQVSTLQSLAVADIAPAWRQMGTAYRRVNQVLVQSGMTWNTDLQTLDDGGSPSGISLRVANQARDDVQQRLSTGLVINAGDDLAANAQSQCVLALLR